MAWWAPELIFSSSASSADLRSAPTSRSARTAGTGCADGRRSCRGCRPTRARAAPSRGHRHAARPRPLGAHAAGAAARAHALEPLGGRPGRTRRSRWSRSRSACGSRSQAEPELLRHTVVAGPIDGDWWRIFTYQFAYFEGGGGGLYAFVAILTTGLFGWLVERRHGPAVVLGPVPGRGRARRARRRRRLRRPVPRRRQRRRAGAARRLGRARPAGAAPRRVLRRRPARRGRLRGAAARDPVRASRGELDGGRGRRPARPVRRVRAERARRAGRVAPGRHGAPAALYLGAVPEP